MANVADAATKQYFLKIKSEDIGIKFLTELFGWRSVIDPETKKPKFIPPKYKQNTRLTLYAREYINETEVQTNLGILIFNKMLIEPYLTKIIPGGYYNEVLDTEGRGKLFNIVSDALKYKKITPEETWPFLKAYEFYSTKCVTIFSPSYTEKIIVPGTQYIKEKNEFYKNNPNPTVDEVVEMEEKIIDEAKKDLANDPGMPLYASGARGSFGDSYKNISFEIGPVLNPESGEFEIMKSNLIDGISKEDIPKAGNMVINGQYPKSVATADSGYRAKQFNAVFQSLMVDEDGTDCGSKAYIEVYLTDSNWHSFEFQNIITDKGLIPLTEDNCKKFIGKKVKMRSPMCCLNTKFCSACAGRRPYILEMPYIGLQLNTIPNRFLEAGMKKFHVSKIDIDHVDPDNLLV